MKYRNDKTKTEHSMIKGLRKLLKKVAKIESVVSIIPGRIKPSKTVNDTTLKVQYKTDAGIKCLAQSDGIQEVFIVCDNADFVIDEIKKL